MKAGEARSIYSAQISALQEQRSALLARKKELEKKNRFRITFYICILFIFGMLSFKKDLFYFQKRSL